MKKILLFASAVAMLASCSKDATEDFAPAQVTGKSKVYATYNVGLDTRTHGSLVEGGKFEYGWDEADAIGLFDATADDVTNASFKNVGGNEFVGDYDMIAHDSYVAYYPHKVGTEYENGEITLTIPANQNYNHMATGMGSFAQNVAPAVAATTEKDEEGNVKFTFTAVTSYLVFPIYGLGTVKSIELEIEDANYLAGEISVNPNDLKDAYVPTAGAQTITLNCGKGVALSMNESKYFWFVVPAGVDYSGKTVTLTVTDTEGGHAELTRTFDAGTNKTRINYAHVWGQTRDDDFFYNPTGSYIVANEFDFIKYAYAATYGLDEKTPVEMLVADTSDPTKAAEPKVLRPAMIVEPLNFEGFDPDSWIKVSQSGKYTEFEIAVITKYASFADEAIEGDFGGIETIGGQATSVKYSISGNVEGKAAEIKGLKVVGNGMFGGKSNTKNVVSDLVLTGINVEGDYLVTNHADYPYSANQSTPFDKLENITVKGGKVSGTPAAVVNNAYTRHLDAVTVEEMPTGEDIKYANSLVVTNDVNTPIAASFREVYAGYSGRQKVVTVAEESVADFIKAINVDKTGKYWFSVVTRDEEGAVDTSYWTGLTANDTYGTRADDVYTAEELAYEVQRGGTDNQVPTNNKVVLTNNIDLRNIAWTATSAVEPNQHTGYTVSSQQPATAGATATVYTISNVKIAEPEVAADAPAAQAATAPRSNYTLFGDNVQVVNVTIKDIAIEVAPNTPSAVVAALARTNTVGANANVTVDGLSFKFGAGAKLGLNDTYGGLYGAADENRYKNMLDGKVNLKDKETVTADARYGNIAGYFNIAINGESKTVDFTGVKVDNPLFGKYYLNFSDTSYTKQSSNLLFKGATAFTDYSKFKFSIPASNTDAQSHSVYVYFGEVKTGGSTFIFRNGLNEK